MTLATARLGLIHHVVPHYNPPNELAVKINDLEPKLIFTSSEIVLDGGKQLKTRDLIE